LPCWHLDLDDDSIEFDNAELRIIDKRTGDNFCLKRWRWGVTGTASIVSGEHVGVSVHSETALRIGRWYKSPWTEPPVSEIHTAQPEG
jgi:hypothetical protein